MSSEEPTMLFHGGMPELWRGTIIKPDMAHVRYVDNCPQCKAQKQGQFGLDPPTPHGYVYATTDRDYARYYASRAVKGWLYQVELLGDPEKSDEDYFPTWRSTGAKVIKVLEKRITLTMVERQRLFIRWGGTEGEFKAMLFDLERQEAGL